MRWAGHEVRIGERRDVYKVLVGKPGVRDHLRDQCVDGRIIISILRKRDVVKWIGSSWLRIGTGGGHL